MGSANSKTCKILNKYNGEETTKEFLYNLSASESEYLLKAPVDIGYKFRVDENVFEVKRVSGNIVCCRYVHTIKNNSINYDLSTTLYYDAYHGGSIAHRFKYCLGEIGKSDYLEYGDSMECVITLNDNVKPTVYKTNKYEQKCNQYRHKGINRKSKHELKMRYIGKDYHINKNNNAPPTYEKVENKN